MGIIRSKSLQYRAKVTFCLDHSRWPAAHILGPRQAAGPATLASSRRCGKGAALGPGPAKEFAHGIVVHPGRPWCAECGSCSAIAGKYGRPLPIAAKDDGRALPCLGVADDLGPCRSEVPADLGAWLPVAVCCSGTCFGGKARMAPASSVITSGSPMAGAQDLAGKEGPCHDHDRRIIRRSPREQG